MKRCGKCKELKPYDDFYKHYKRGRGSYCKPCQHDHYRRRYEYRTKVLKQPWQPFKNEYKDRNRIFVTDYLNAHPCVDCGERDVLVLEFDHIAGVKRADISKLVNKAASIESLATEIGKCAVRCANCHRRRTAEQFGWLSKRKPIFRRARKGTRDVVPCLKLW